MKLLVLFYLITTVTAYSSLQMVTRIWWEAVSEFIPRPLVTECITEGIRDAIRNRDKYEDKEDEKEEVMFMRTPLHTVYEILEKKLDAEKKKQLSTAVKDLEKCLRTQTKSDPRKLFNKVVDAIGEAQVVQHVVSVGKAILRKEKTATEMRKQLLSLLEMKMIEMYVQEVVKEVMAGVSEKEWMCLKTTTKPFFHYEVYNTKWVKPKKNKKKGSAKKGKGKKKTSKKKKSSKKSSGKKKTGKGKAKKAKKEKEEKIEKEKMEEKKPVDVPMEEVTKTNKGEIPIPSKETESLVKETTPTVEESIEASPKSKEEL